MGRQPYPDGYSSSRPRVAITTASSFEWAPSFVSMLCTWLRTVFVLTKSRAAMSEVDKPSATSLSTSRSRSCEIGAGLAIGPGQPRVPAARACRNRAGARRRPQPAPPRPDHPAKGLGYDARAARFESIDGGASFGPAVSISTLLSGLTRRTRRTLAATPDSDSR